MAVQQEHRYQNVTELYHALYEQQSGASAVAANIPVAAPNTPVAVPPTTVPLSSTPQQYQHPQQQYQPQPQQPQPIAQTPPKKKGLARWTISQKVMVCICVAVLTWFIIFPSGLPSGTPPNDDVIVTATPPSSPIPTPVPVPARISLEGTWVTREQDYATEFAFDDTNNRFYMVYIESTEDNPYNFIVVEGTFSISDDNLMITSTWGVASNDGINTAVEIDNEQWRFTFNLSGQTLTIFDEDGLPEVYTGGQTLGVWSFNHRETTVFSEFVEDMPYVLHNAHATIPGIYTGQWANSAPNGIGEFIYTESGEAHTGGGAFIEGTILRGTFVNGLLEGYGEFLTDDGHHYEGNFVEGLRTGQGKYTWPDGMVHEGEFKNNQSHGPGRRTAESGLMVEGTFADGFLQGFGRIEFTDGRVFEGEFKDGRRNGSGTLWDADGAILQEGIWEDGEFQG
jgi:hypothetical protein